MNEKKSVSEEFEKNFKELDNELTLLHFKWNVFNQLFNRNKERIEILNETAPQFFVLIQNILIDDLQLSICKLAEFHKTGGNLSLEILIKQLENEHSSLKNDLRQIFEDLRIVAKPFRNSRNKVISHLDYDSFVNNKVRELKSFKIKELESILELARNFMNRINSYFWDSTSYYEKQWSLGDGDALIEYLKIAIHCEDLMQKNEIKPYSMSQSKHKNA